MKKHPGAVLQVNDSGAWRNVCHLPSENILAVAAAVGALAMLVGERPTWRVVKSVNGYHKVLINDAGLRRGASNG